MSKTKIAGWVLSLSVAGFLVAASLTCKLNACEGQAELLAHMGYTADLFFRIGILEVIVALLFLVPRLELPAAILLTAHMGGATATNVRVGDSILLPVVIGMLVWVALVLRRKEVLRLLRFDGGVSG